MKKMLMLALMLIASVALADEYFDYSTAGVIRTPQGGSEPVLAWIVKGGAAEKITTALEEL